MIAVWKEETIAAFICRDATCNKQWQILRKLDEHFIAAWRISKDHITTSDLNKKN